jgi:hypothetical protein
MTTRLNEAGVTLLRMIVEVADRLETGNCPNIYSRFGNTLRALEARGLVTYEGNMPDYRRPIAEHRVVYTATPTEAGRAALAEIKAAAEAVA